MASMRPLTSMSPEAAAKVRGLLFDIDDTLTTEGKLTAPAFSALWEAHDAGLLCVAITGRPAGWCDHIARMWPVAGVVGENGGLYFAYRGGKLLRRYRYDEVTRAANRKRLEAIRHEILRDFPEVGVASDQPYREFDLAIDFREDVPPVPEERVDRVVETFRAHGATAKVSSIHVNGWFGEYDKLSMCRDFLREQHDFALDARRDELVYVGDSPNDEPMFRFFPLSVGVANVVRFATRLRHPPSFVTAAEAGDGFAELVHFLLSPTRSG